MKAIKSPSKPKRGEPAWEIADLYPPQGYWSEFDYLALETNRLVEYDDGFIQVLPVPTTSHQRIVVFLFQALSAFVEAGRLGEVLVAPLRVRTSKKKYREPDIVFMKSEHADRIGEEYWEGADLVVQIVSDDPDSRKRDLHKKRNDYAAARIPEYWIVDPHEKQITVLRLKGRKYVEHGVFKPGEQASSHLLEGFTIEATKVLKAKR